MPLRLGLGWSGGTDPGPVITEHSFPSGGFPGTPPGESWVRNGGAQVLLDWIGMADGGFPTCCVDPPWVTRGNERKKTNNLIDCSCSGSRGTCRYCKGVFSTGADGGGTRYDFFRSDGGARARASGGCLLGEAGCRMVNYRYCCRCRFRPCRQLARAVDRRDPGYPIAIRSVTSLDYFSAIGTARKNDGLIKT